MKDNKGTEGREAFAPKTSIIIPVYNGSNYLAEAIDSALGQSYKNTEVVVVNDGSDDEGRTRDIALSYGNRIRYFEKENGGVATALNLGIREMTGEYFSWLSHDDLYYPQKIAIQVEWLKNHENKEVILFSNFTIRNCVTGTTTQGEVLSEGELTVFSALRILFASRIHGCSMLFPRSCFRTVGLFSEELRTTQDYDFFFKILKAGYTFHHIPHSTMLTRHHKEQGTMTLSELHVRELNKLYVWAFEFFFEQFESFSIEQLDMILGLVKNRGLKDAYSRIKDFRDCKSNMAHIEADRPVIWLYWENKQGQEVPEVIKLCWETIKRRNEREFRIILTNRDNISYYLPHLNTSVWSFEQIAHRADYIRFNLLYEYGGIWLDSDFVAFRSLSPVLQKIRQYGFVYAGYKQADGIVFPMIAFLGSKKHNPVIGLLLQNADGVLDSQVTIGRQPAWDEIGGGALREIVNDENSFRYDAHCFAPLAVHANSQKEIFYPVGLPRRFRRVCFGQMLPYSVYSQFLNLMGRQVMNMDCFLARILRKNIRRKTLCAYKLREYGLDTLRHDFLVRLRAILSPQVYDQLRSRTIMTAEIARMLITDPKQFWNRFRQRLGRRICH